MCLFQHLHHGENGYVIRCTECNHYQVGFYTTVLTLNEPDFGLFRELAVQKLLQAKSVENDALKSIVLPTPYDKVKMLMSKSELHEFASMLEKACNEETALAMIQLFAAS